MNVEAWLRGPLPGVPPLLMPTAHALVQSGEELDAAVTGLSTEELWSRPGGAASIGFHLRHIVGVLDRLFTYARGGRLNPAQFAALQHEGAAGTPPATAHELLAAVHAAIDTAVASLQATDEHTLFDARAVGRAQLPTNVLGLLAHAGEHAQRHTGQAVTTAKIIRGLGVVTSG